MHQECRQLLNYHNRKTLSSVALMQSIALHLTKQLVLSGWRMTACDFVFKIKLNILGIYCSYEYYFFIINIIHFRDEQNMHQLKQQKKYWQSSFLWSRSSPVLLFSKLNKMFVGCFNPDKSSAMMGKIK